MYSCRFSHISVFQRLFLYFFILYLCFMKAYSIPRDLTRKQKDHSSVIFYSSRKMTFHYKLKCVFSKESSKGSDPSVTKTKERNVKQSQNETNKRIRSSLYNSFKDGYLYKLLFPLHCRHLLHTGSESEAAPFVSR